MTEEAIVTYVYENTEVIKTGREAQKTLRSGKTDVVVEITPRDQCSGVWKKWVRDDELFVVKP